ncbi:MAG TPA: hypothetical protein VKJ00_00425 [Thermoanaerobaculia bacterium]|nr:hypothetical protein [Thermoanaerobaculia bacterium]
MHQRHYRRPRVSRYSRPISVVLPPRSFRITDPPHSAWRESMKALAGASLDNWPQLLTIGLGILAYFTLLSH